MTELWALFGGTIQVVDQAPYAIYGKALLRTAARFE